MTSAPRDARIDELVLGAVGDVRDLISGHGEAIRKDIKDSVGELKDLLVMIAVAGLCALVGTVMLALAVAATLVRIGLEAWIAMWIVTGVIAVIAVIALRRARRRAKTADVVPDDSLERAGEDVKWVAERAADVVTETSDEPGAPHGSLDPPDRRPDREHAR